MNYSSKFDATVSDALGKHAGGHVFSETVHASHVPSDAIVVPDAQLLFGGEFKRAGVDLVLSGDGREFVLHDYFKGEKHAPLASPDGAHLTGDLVNALAGQVQIAQAGGNAAAGQVIGHVTKLAGTATAIRNGVSIILNNGDNVEKGDVVASGSDSTVGITFIDGTVFGLSSNARMVLNEMVYDPNGSNNSSLLSLVAGTITFVAGETAKHGDMKVDTPVATMGIRGTAVLVEIDFSVPGATPDAKFQVLVEPDGTTGSYILFDKTTLTPLAVVDKAGMQINVSNGVMSQTLAPLSPEIQKLITDVFSLKFSDSTNTKSIEHFTDSIVPNVFGLVNFALVNGNLSTFAALPPPPAGSGPAAPSAATIGHIAQAPNFSGEQTGKITEAPHVTGITAPDTATGQFQYFDINTSDHDTVSVKFSSFTYQNAKGQDVSGSLNSLQLADIAKVEAAITVSENTGPNTIGNGTANWSYSVADKAFDFLAAGETLTLTYTATVDNNYQPLDQTGTQTITITITGTNDAPMITSPQQNVSFVSAGTDTKGGELIPNTATHGTLNFADPDLTDTHTVAVKMASALLNGQPLSNTVGQSVINELAAAVTASISSSGGHDSTLTGAGTIEWTLANLQVYLADLIPNGESLVLTYAVTVADSATPPATFTQDIVVTIGGNEGAAVVWVNTTPIPEGGVALWSTASNWEGDRAPSTLGTDDVIIGTDQVLPGTPVFPATVNDAEAVKSLTMDYFTDFGSSIPELDILSTGSLTIVDALNMDTSTDSGSPLTAESIVKNFGTLSVGGIATLLKHSVLDNYGTITLAEGGVFGDQSSVTNSGTITFTEAGNFEDLSTVANSNTIIFDNGGNFVEQSVVSNTGSILSSVTNSGTIEVAGGTLDVAAGIDNSGGTLQVDNGVVLEITDGFIVNSDGSTSSIGTTISNGTLTIAGGGTLDIESSHGATLDGVQVIGTNKTNSVAASLIEVGATAAAILLLDDGTSIENGNLTISGGSALDITTGGAALDGVNVTGADATLSVAASTIEVGTTTTTGTVLTLDDGTTITNGNLIVDSGNTLDIESSQGATLDGVNVMNSGTIQVGSSATLTLEGGTTITGGVIDDAGTLSVGALSEIENATINGGGDLTVTSGTLTLSEVTLDGVTLAGSFTNSDKLTIKDTVTLNGATINGGTIDDTGTLSVSTASTIENATVDGGGNLTATSAPLTLSGVTLDDVTLTGLFTNSGTLTIKDTVTLTGMINGGTIDDTGTLSVTSGVIEGATVDGGGNLTSTGAGGASLAGVTLDNVTVAGIFTNASTLKIDDTVTLDGATINGSTIDDTGTLSVSTASTIENAIANGGGNLTATSATLTLSEVLLENLTLAGSFTNSNTLVTEGTVTLNGATISGGEIEDPGTLSVSASSEIENATVDGAGHLTATSAPLTLSEVTLDEMTLSGSFTNADTLTIDDTVTLNGATLNGGTIDDTGTLSVIASSKIENATVDGTGDLTVTGGTLTLSEVTLDGVTLAGSFSNADTLTIDDTVTLNGATLNGGTIDDTGTLSVSASSKIENATVDGTGDLTVTGGTLTLSEVTLDGVTLAGSFTNADTLTIDDTVTLNGATLNGGTIDDTGTLSVSASSEIENATVTGDITVDSGKTLTLNTVTLDGVTLSGGTDDATSVTVSADSTIESAAVAGDITVGSGKTLTLDTVTLDGVTLSGGTDKVTAITVGADSTIKNATVSNGVITVDSGVTLTLDTVTLNGTSFADTTTGGTILVGSGTTLTFNGATIDGGTLNIQGELDSTGSSTISGATIINQNLINIVSGTLTIDPTPMTNTGTIEVHSGAGLVLDDDAVTNSGSSGDGTIQVDQNATLTLEDSSITGGVIKNFGTIDLTGDSSFSGLSSFVNEGTLEAEGTLTLTGMTINNAGHILKSSGSGVIDLVNTTINGGTLGGKIATVSPNKSSTLNGVTLAFGTLVTAAVGVLELTGTIFNNGEVDATAGALDLVNATVDGGTFGGHGTITTASGNSDSVLSGVTIASGSTVTAAVGTLDLTGITTNNGEIDATTGTLHLHNADVIGGTLGGSGTISTDSLNQFSILKNVTIAAGAKVSASAGVFELTGTINNHGEIDATTGTIELINADIVGGTLGGHGTITTASAFNTFNGVTIASGTTVEVADGTVLDLVGTITDAGTIALGASGDFTGLEISGNVVLNGGGTVTMNSDFYSFIASDGSAAKLSNLDTISGAGTIGDSHLTLSNSGTIDATGTHALIIDTGVNSFTSGGLVGNLLVTNNVGGVLEASAGHTLQIDDNVLNNGLIQSGTSGSHSSAYVDVTGNISGTGSIDIFNNSTVEIGGSVSSGQTVTFGSAGAAGTLILDDSHDFHGTISGLVEADPESAENHVDLTDLTYTANKMSFSFNSTTDMLTITNNSSHAHPDSVSLHIATGSNFSAEFEIHSDTTIGGSGGTLLDDPSATGVNTIDSGDVLGILAASSATINFTNTAGTTGELLLADSKDFTGTIAGFTGDGTTANSDLIDVTDVNIADVALNKTTYTDHGNGTGTLTLYNASGQALDSVNFDGNYQLANFTIENDGDGGTLIVDPPVNTSGQAPGGTTVASNENSTGTAGADGFAFNFAGHHHAPTTDFHPDQESFQPGGPALTNLHTGSNGAPDQGHSNMPLGGDGQDHVGLSAFAKAHLHAADFHFV